MTAVIRLGAWDNERVLVSAEYDTGNMLLTGIIIENNGAFAISAIVIHPTTRLEIASRIFSSGTTFRLPVDTTLALFDGPDSLALPTQFNIQYPAS